jgi:SAM-dependent methyltransferase
MKIVFDSYADYYDLLYKDKNYVGEGDYILDLLKRNNVESGEILELGCGTGSYSRHLVEAGFSVLGTDLSDKMIDLASSKILDRQLSNLSFRVGDARTFRCNREFDAVVCLFHVASYLSSNTDFKHMLETAWLHLKPGGILIFDFWYGPGVLSDPPVTRVKKMQDDNLSILRIAEPTMDFGKNIATVHYDVIATHSDGSLDEFSEEHSMRYFFLPELDLFLSDSGFHILDNFEWMTNHSLVGNPWYVVCIAKKLESIPIGASE